MEGVTISEIAQALKIAPGTVKMRLIRAEIQPISYAGPTGIYASSAIEAIRTVSGRGRPKGKPKQ